MVLNMNKIDKINNMLPQTQCKRCGYSSCRPYAEAILFNKEDINRCPPGGNEVVEELANYMGLEKKPINPECGIASSPKIFFIDESECIGCGLCIPTCPVDAIAGAFKFMHTIIKEECTGCELCIDPCPVDCIELIEVSEEESLKIRKNSDHFFQLKNELVQRKNKKTKLNKSISENLDLAKSINKKLSNRNVDKEKSIKKLQTEMLNSQKAEKHINPSDIENLKKQL